MDMREQKFGIEIEMTGITRQRAAEVMAAYFSSTFSYDGGSYEEYSVRNMRISLSYKNSSGSSGMQVQWQERIQASMCISTRHPMMQGHCGTSPTSCTARKI